MRKYGLCVTGLFGGLYTKLDLRDYGIKVLMNLYS